MYVYATELEKWVESGLSTFEIRRLVAEIYFIIEIPYWLFHKLKTGKDFFCNLVILKRILTFKKPSTSNFFPVHRLTIVLSIVVE